MPELGQSVHGIYRHGKLRFWMKSQPTSPSLLQGFENYICAKSGKNHREKRYRGRIRNLFLVRTYVLLCSTLTFHILKSVETKKYFCDSVTSHII